MIRMRTALPQADECSLHCFRLRTALLKLGIELDHEFLSAVVVNVPQAQERATALPPATGRGPSPSAHHRA